MTRHGASLLLAVALAFGAWAIAGCGGGGGGPQPQADVPIDGQIATAANQINSVIVSTATAGDTVDVSAATARIERADGTSADVTLNANAGGTRVTLGSATVVPSATQWNVLVIQGPIRFIDGATGTVTVIGRLEFRFEVLPDGTVVHPATLSVHIPTQGAATDSRIVFTGLSANPQDFVQTVIIDNQGGITESSIHGADAQGRVALRDSQGSITADVLTGNNSRVILMFARTDADTDGVPDLME